MNIQRAAVLGAGTMGSRIAAHFANAGIPCLLLDMADATGGDRNALALRGIRAAMEGRPPAFFDSDLAQLITPGNFDDNLPDLASCDWVVEVVAEDLEIKRRLWSRVSPYAAPEAILSTNTSGIPLAQLASAIPNQLQSRFLGTHFFNPPRYLHLVELVPGPATDKGLLAAVGDFCDVRLGKGVVPCKDTPNFIANRIGAFYSYTAFELTTELGLSIEEVDLLTGPLIGFPRSATYRLVDIIGADIWHSVGSNIYEMAPEDPARERFRAPAFLREMIARGLLGDKSGGGFYKRLGAEQLVLELESLEYRAPAKLLRAEQSGIPELGARLQALVNLPDNRGTFLWRMFRDVFLYASSLVAEISDRTVEIDRAMRWGYAHSLGPFELWDALGFAATAKRMEDEGRSLPPLVQAMLRAGADGFYRHRDHPQYFDLVQSRYWDLTVEPGKSTISYVKRSRGVVWSAGGASLFDLGDGALCLSWEREADDLTSWISTLDYALNESKHWKALLIAGEGETFQTGLSLATFARSIESCKWDEGDWILRKLQQIASEIRTHPQTIVCAPFGRVGGPGWQVMMQASARQASAELYAMLNDVHAGLIPVTGCSAELPRRVGSMKAFELLLSAPVSTSAVHARRLGLLRHEDGISINPERLLEDAKSLALTTVPTPRASTVRVGGAAAFDDMRRHALSLRDAGKLTEHDFVIAEKLAWVLSGGGGEPREVTFQETLDLEREAVLSLCGMDATKARIGHLLKTGKPLRN